MIEAIFQQLSPRCRSEMEAAMETSLSQSQTQAQAESSSSSSAAGDVSDSCKLEIQESAQRVAGEKRDKTAHTGSGPGSASSSSSSSSGGVAAAAAEEAAAAAAAAKSSSQSVLLVVAALVALLGAVVGYIVYVNANLSQHGKGQKKSLRKKVNTAACYCCLLLLLPATIVMSLSSA
jgi:cobalamin biosynthesis Mg chelatase CobN